MLEVENLRSPEKTHSNFLSPSKKVFKSRAENAVNVDLYAMTRKFRLDPKSMRCSGVFSVLIHAETHVSHSKKKEYQILYFPMTAPLTDYEKSKRKMVKSTKLS
jgi:hypothetical protein